MPNEDIPLTCKGRGGTDFRPAFDWVRDNASDARVLIYLTDGWGEFPKEVPDIPTLWLSWDLAESGYPFGQVVPLSVLNNITA
jgi:predicted metal-dependent peptidase